MDIHKSNDKLLKKRFEQKEVVIEFLKDHLPPTRFDALNLNSLTLVKESFLDSKAKGVYSDVTYKVEVMNQNLYFYFLLCRQNKCDLLVIGLLLQYMANIFNHDITQQMESNPQYEKIMMPDIKPFVLYLKNKKDKQPTLFPVDLKSIFPMGRPGNFMGLRTASLDDLPRNKKSALGQTLLKESSKKGFSKVLKENPKLSELINESPYATDAILYMVDIDPLGEEIIEKITNLDEKIKQKVMGNLMEIEKKGRLEGIKIGEERGLKSAFHKLLAHGIDKTKAAELLELTPAMLKRFIKK